MSYRPRPKEGDIPVSHKLTERLYDTRRKQTPPLSPEDAARKTSNAGYPTTGEDWRGVESTNSFPTNGKSFAEAVERSGLGDNHDIQQRMGYDVLHDRFGKKVADNIIEPPEDILPHK